MGRPVQVMVPTGDEVKKILGEVIKLVTIPVILVALFYGGIRFYLAYTNTQTKSIDFQGANLNMQSEINRLQVEKKDCQQRLGEAMTFIPTPTENPEPTATEILLPTTTPAL